MSGYRVDHPEREPALEEIFYFPDGRGPFRVVDWLQVDTVDGNILVVESLSE